MKFILSIRGTTVLRMGIALVFLWFGLEQFFHTDMWIGFLPQWLLDISPVGPTTLVHLNGAVETVFALSLFFGLFTRISALILALHMGHITYIVGYTSIGIRDFGLMIAAFAVFLDGADPITLDYLFLLEPKKPDKLPGQDAPFKYITPEFHPPDFHPGNRL
jgi:uncharacterized membrane protein YphA (DoxX/SURF4 family)